MVPLNDPRTGEMVAVLGMDIDALTWTWDMAAQREITNRAALLAYLNRLVEADLRRILFISMNPFTDAVLMEELRRSMRHPERAATLTGRYEPGDILAAAAAVDVFVSSRLHLLILASIVHIPFVGISRGPKVDHFLALHGLSSAATGNPVILTPCMRKRCACSPPRKRSQFATAPSGATCSNASRPPG